jgi:hypothetical protein
MNKLSLTWAVFITTVIPVFFRAIVALPLDLMSSMFKLFGNFHVPFQSPLIANKTKMPWLSRYCLWLFHEEVLFYGRKCTGSRLRVQIRSYMYLQFY